MRSGVPTFVPGRLTEAREVRGLTVTQLADLVGVTKQSVSAYERGRQVPTPRVLEELAQKLNLPVHFFVRKLPEQPTNTIYFRSLAATSKRARVRAKRRLAWLEDIIEYLTQFIEFMPSSLPYFDVGDPLALSFERIEDIARECRREFGIGNGPISNVVRLLENHGVILTRQEFDTRTLDAFSMRSAKLDIPIIVLGSDKDSAARSRFDAAHELGHLILHHSVTKLGPLHKLLEHQANRFAGAFLLPTDSFTGDLGVLLTLNSLWVLKRKWKVSIAAMIHRCEDLDLLSEEQAKRLWIRHAQKGFKTREPLDDELPIEQPVFLQRCFELIVSQQIQTKEDIIANLPMAALDIEDLAGLNRGYFSRPPGRVEYLPKLRHKTEGLPRQETPGTLLTFPPKK